MKKQIQWLTKITAIAATLLMWGCDDVGNVNAPQLDPAPMTVQSSDGETLVVAYEKDPESGTVSATIGPRGGIIGLGKHVVYVTRNAVSEPTEFTITRAPELPIRVKLTAGEDNEVGENGFNAPVILGLSMGDAANVPDDADRKNATVVYYRGDGKVDVLDSRVYGHLVIARLPHFSLFGLAWP